MTVPRHVRHPFLGFTNPSGYAVRDLIKPKRLARLCAPDPVPEPSSSSWCDVIANRMGYFSPVEYPCNGPTGDLDPYVVGVFGGSVAQWFALQVGDVVADGLAGTDPLGGRTPLVLNYASGGWKQPQTTLALTSALAAGQRFDAVVLIDGFNDASLSFQNWRRGYRFDDPCMQHMASIGDDRPVAPEGPVPADQDEAVARIAELWARGARLFHDICRARDIVTVHLLQPNQYHSARQFTPDELDGALSTTSPYPDGVRAVYPVLRRQIARLARDGYDVMDATTAFDDVTETVYADTCCHYNRRGNLALTGLVVDGLLLATRADRRTVSAPDTTDVSEDVHDVPAPPTPDPRYEAGAADDDGSDPADFVYPMW
jgi:hypothetical protein